MTIVVLLKSLKNIYENSNFYKEARIVSFIDRLLESIVGKIKSKMAISLSVTRGMREYEVLLQDINIAQSILQKFSEVTTLITLIFLVESVDR